MRLPVLIHLVQAAQTLSRCQRVCVLGSSSLLASFPELGEPGAPLEFSYAADLLLDPGDEQIAAMLHEAIGEGSLFAEREGYHADIVRPQIRDTLPTGWDERLVPLPSVATASALAPADLVVVKLRLGRPKDLELCRHLFLQKLMNPPDVKARLEATPLPEPEIVPVYRRFREVIE